jgi:hypothetical protein
MQERVSYVKRHDDAHEPDDQAMVSPREGIKGG